MPEYAGAAACFGVVLGLAAAVLWVYLLLRALAALELLARSHAELAHAVHRVADALSARGQEAPPGAVEADWRSEPPPGPTGTG
jgi:hypothetical protein